MSDEVQNIIRTKELRLVDNSGRECAVLSSGDNGSAMLTFLDHLGKSRTRIGVTAQGQAVVELTSGDAPTPNFSLAVEADGRVMLEGIDNEGVERFKLEIKANGSHTEMSFHEKYKKPRLTIIAEDKGPAGLFIMDHNGRALFSTMP